MSTFVFEAPGLVLEVHDDRVEVEARKRHQTIPLSGVAEVLVVTHPKRLAIVTTEGKRYEFLLGKDAEAARAAITSRLAGAR